MENNVVILSIFLSNRFVDLDVCREEITAFRTRRHFFYTMNEQKSYTKLDGIL